jgi:hypothetical protein
MPWPTDVVPGAEIESADINAGYLAVRVWGGDVEAAGYNLKNLGGLALGIAAPAKINSASSPHTQIARMVSSLHLGAETQGVNDDGFLQLGAWNFASGNNWSGLGAFGVNYAVKSVGGVDTQYTPLTHGSLGYSAIETASGYVKIYVATGATTAGGSVTPLTRLSVEAGAIKMWLDGSLKTLSVDGSGFVKAA